MADSKLSPRQKMINMMYLVLTAMLALNVSAEILQAFESLRQSLENTASAHGAQNLSLSDDIIRTIGGQEKQGNTKYSHVRDIIAEVNGETILMVSYLDSINMILNKFGQKDPITGELKKKDETDKNYHFWMGGNDLSNDGHGNGKAAELRERLNQYVNWANDLYSRHDSLQQGPKFRLPLLEPSGDPGILDPASKSKTWELHTFGGKPVIADLALVEKFKMDVRDVQSGLLNLSKTIVQGFTFTVDSLIAIESPNAEVVAAGMKFQTKLAVGLASKSIVPEFVGPGITMDKGGSTATMTIAANGNVIPEGKTEGIQHYTALIKVPRADGKTEVIQLKSQFIVRKPEVVVRSKALQLLYRNCGNTVEVDVPALGESYNPDFTKSVGGHIIKSNSSKKDITIVPDGGEFKLSVHSNTNGQNVKIDQLTYKVIKPPAPRLALFDKGKEINGMMGLSKKQNLTVKLLPEEEFAKTLREDARYRAKKITLMLQDNLSPPRTIQTFSGADIQKGVEISLNVGEIRSTYPGARIFFEVEDVERINFQGKAIAEDMPRTVRVLPGMINR